MSHPTLSILIFLMAFLCHPATAQTDSSVGAIQQLSGKYIKKVDARIGQYSNRLTAKTEKTATDILHKIPAFKQFMQQNRMLASLFKKPADAGGRFIGVFAPQVLPMDSLIINAIENN